jgi:hypothetical protein
MDEIGRALAAYAREVADIAGAVVPFPTRRDTGAGEDDVDWGRGDRGRSS